MNRYSIAAALLIGASLLPTAVYAQSTDPAPLQRTETQLYLDGVQYACVRDPSSWRATTPAHDALVEQGYATSVWIASHPGFAPFSDQDYYLCRTPVGELT